ncbi:Fur family transcriptional regulator [Nostoc parmelioides]|uniref:Transcriptional repressor n=1 Tax=Nostoc parmelioides FACHB-3921 TaxID=2692909 RepID=A0ABR8BJN2_9NOSO|nr:transcriptional repressor [Nostoc parmelioides]MBD2253342.1 transcriptional repressor [Nostoc parmelioides FACHB-3921]
MDNLDSLKSKFNTQGYRFTPQRQLIFDFFQTLPTGKHLSAESLHLLLLERGEAMSLSTVYRILKIMTNMGIIREVELAQAQKHYELNTISTHHHHIVCVQCHQIIEFENKFILQQGLRQVETIGWQLIDCKFTLQTICPEALQRGWPKISSNWVCPRFLKADKEKNSTHQQPDLKTGIKEKSERRIDLKGEYIVVYIPKDEIENCQHKAKLITGWRFSRTDKTWHFPVEKSSDVLNLFPGYEIDPKILKI